MPDLTDEQISDSDEDRLDAHVAARAAHLADLVRVHGSRGIEFSIRDIF